MACTTTPAPGDSKRALLDQLDAIDTRLYFLQHFCDLVSDIAGASEIGAQANQVKAETLQVVFGWIAKQAEEIRNTDMDPIRKAVAS
jgi:hypothetical protein